MNEKAFIKYISNYLSDKNVVASSTAINSFISPKYLNSNLLANLDSNSIIRNTDKILNEVIQVYEERTAESIRATKVRDLDVRPVLRKRFCSMPPFCKDK